MSTVNRPWYRELNRYHWFVFVVAALGWLFDTMDQQLFNLARLPACTELLGTSASDPRVGEYGGYATSIFLIGWATGGIAFGIMGDRIGRAKTMMWTILIYSACTGLSALSKSVWDFAMYRFLTGLGVGGEFAVGISLVAEVMPDRARPFALGLLQALSAIGNVTAALISMSLSHLEKTGAVGVGHSWRWMFVVGTVPALLAVLIRRRLKEPERWQANASEEAVAKRLGSYSELFGDPRWRKNAIVGLMLAFSGVVGLWGIGFFSIDLNRLVFRKTFESEARDQGEAVKDQAFLQHVFTSPDVLDRLDDKIQPANLLSLKPEEKDAERLFGAALELQKQGRTVSKESALELLDEGIADKGWKPQSADERSRREAYLAADVAAAKSADDEIARIAERTKAINGRLGFWAAITSVMINVGAFFGIYAFSLVTHVLGRKPTFAISFVLAMLSTALAFWKMQTITDVFWMIPLMGFCQLSLFGGYAIYFPELFPTHLRSTGTSFCYNVGRFVAAIGPTALGLLTSEVFADKPEPMRYAGVTMCSVFLVGLLALPFAPETRGQPLPE
ncbi:MAG TPA: MFS transporter [Pirellulales bacterium]|nr:MFS transporter [Pirellulales bacterium]